MIVVVGFDILSFFFIVQEARPHEPSQRSCRCAYADREYAIGMCKAVELTHHELNVSSSL